MTIASIPWTLAYSTIANAGTVEVRSAGIVAGRGVPSAAARSRRRRASASICKLKVRRVANVCLGAIGVRVSLLDDVQEVQCRVETRGQLTAVGQRRLRRFAEIGGHQYLCQRNHRNLQARLSMNR